MQLPDWNHSSSITAHLWLNFTGYIFFLVKKKKTELLAEAQSKVKEFEEKSLPSMK